MEQLKLNIITPNGVFYDDYVNNVTINNENGKISFYKNYASTIGIINIGHITIIDANNNKKEMLIGKGAYIIADNILKIMTLYFLEDNEENIKYIEKQKNDSINILNAKSNNKINFAENLNISKIIKQLRRK